MLSLLTFFFDKFVVTENHAIMITFCPLYKSTRNYFARADALQRAHRVYLYEASQAHFLDSLNTAFISCEISPRKNPTQRIQFASFAYKILELLLNKETTIVEYTCLTKFQRHSSRCKKENSLSVYKQSWCKVTRIPLLFPDPDLTEGKGAIIFR